MNDFTKKIDPDCTHHVAFSASRELERPADCFVFTLHYLLMHPTPHPSTPPPFTLQKFSVVSATGSPAVSGSL